MSLFGAGRFKTYHPPQRGAMAGSGPPQRGAIARPMAGSCWRRLEPLCLAPMCLALCRVLCLMVCLARRLALCLAHQPSDRQVQAHCQTHGCLRPLCLALCLATCLEQTIGRAMAGSATPQRLGRLKG